MVVTLPIGLPGWNLNPLLLAFCTAAAFDLDPVLMITTSLGTISRQLNRSRHVGHLASLPSRPPSCCSNPFSVLRGGTVANRKHIDNFSQSVVSPRSPLKSHLQSLLLSLPLCLSLFWETVGYIAIVPRRKTRRNIGPNSHTYAWFGYWKREQTWGAKARQPASQPTIHPSAAKATATHSHTIHADMGYTLTERTKRPTDRQQQQPTTTRLYAVYTWRIKTKKCVKIKVNLVLFVRSFVLVILFSFIFFGYFIAYYYYGSPFPSIFILPGGSVVNW